MPRPIIHVDGLLWFDGTGDIVIEAAGKQAVDAEPQRLLDALRIAIQYSRNSVLVHAAQGQGPLSEYDELDFEEFLVLLEEIAVSAQQSQGARNAKVTALKARRSQFGANRSALILKMLAAGVPYRCAHPECAIVEDLTVDHRLPVSLGGTDDIENLQFMCLPHNSAKGARI